MDGAKISVLPIGKTGQNQPRGLERCKLTTCNNNGGKLQPSELTAEIGNHHRNCRYTFN